MQKDNQNNWEYERRSKPSPSKKRREGESNPGTNAPGRDDKDPTKKPKRKKSGF